MTVSEKAAYLKGLMAGMKMSESSDEGKLFAAIADLLEDLSLAVSDLEEETAVIRDYLDELDTDLAEVETEVYGLDDCDCDCDCDCCDEDDIVELECPACGEVICIEEEELEDCEQLECPACGKMLNVVCEDCEEEDDEDDE